MSLSSHRYDLMLRGFCESEYWKSSHDDAMRVRDVEEVIAFGVALFEYLQQRESRAYKVTPEAQWDEVDLEFAGLFAQWHATAQSVEIEARKFVEQGFEVDGIEQLREAIPQAAPYAEALALPLVSEGRMPLTNDDLIKIAATHQPPAWWFEGEDA